MTQPTSTDAPARWSRRALFSLAGLAAAPRAAAAQIRNPGLPAPTVVQDLQLKLVRRATYGLTPADVQSVYALGYQQYLAQQLDPVSIDDSACDARLVPLTTIGLPTSDLYSKDSGLVTREVTDSMILRAMFSKRQLFERTVEFWTDHFTTNINTVGIYKTTEVREVYRKFAFATFKEMLSASMASPAMLIYLNGDQNTRTAPNQNYAREIMELHTLGVNGGYSHQDIIEVARCFTGWRYRRSTGDATGGTTYFEPTRHDTATKTVLGQTIPAATGMSGMNDAAHVINILANHPSTATFVSRKLLRWFLDYEPSAALVADIAQTFSATQGNIREVIRRILTPEYLMAARPLFKRPYHFIVSAVRALNVNVTALDSIRGSYLPSVGQSPFTWGPPNGFPQDYDYWGTLPLPRWNFGFLLANGSVSGSVPNVTTFFAGATTAQQMADRIDRVIFADEMPRADKSALVTYLRPDPPTTTRMRDALGLALASPGFQWH
jgi:uncharacterized protein (DUF1800 family)